MRSRTINHHLADEILMAEVFSKLPLSAQCAARFVCKHWRALLRTIGNLGRVPEGYMIVNAVDHLLLYNVSLSRWMKPLPLASLPLSAELKNPTFCAVFEEHFFFRDRSEPPRLAIWNAVTNESRVLDEVAAIPGKYDVDQDTLQFGAFVKKSNGELKLTLLVFNVNIFEYPDGYLYRWSWNAPDAWTEVPLVNAPLGPNFNNRLGLVTFVNEQEWIQVYSVERDNFIRMKAFVEAYDWAMTMRGARFVMNSGIYVIGMFIRDEPGPTMGVLRVDEEEMKVVCEIPPDHIFNSRQHLFCSDGEESIWILEPDLPVMVRVNVVSGEWVNLPTILDRFPDCCLLPSCGALYTTVQ